MFASMAFEFGVGQLPSSAAAMTVGCSRVGVMERSGSYSDDAARNTCVTGLKAVEQASDTDTVKGAKSFLILFLDVSIIK